VSASLVVRPLDGARYVVTSGDHTYTVDASNNPPACSCEAYRYFPKARPCKHGHAVISYRAEPVAGLLDVLTDDQVLDLVDPSYGDAYPPVGCVTIDPDDRAVAIVALEQWGEYRRRKQKPPYLLWRAACSAMAGLECERSDPRGAAAAFAVARGMVTQLAQQPRGA